MRKMKQNLAVQSFINLLIGFIVGAIPVAIIHLEGNIVTYRQWNLESLKHTSKSIILFGIFGSITGIIYTLLLIKYGKKTKKVIKFIILTYYLIMLTFLFILMWIEFVIAPGGMDI